LVCTEKSEELEPLLREHEKIMDSISILERQVAKSPVDPQMIYHWLKVDSLDDEEWRGFPDENVITWIPIEMRELWQHLKTDERATALSVALKSKNLAGR
jgi:hypothetical protein